MLLRMTFIHPQDFSYVEIVLGVPDNLCRAILGRRQYEEAGVGVYLETSGDNQGYQEESKLSHCVFFFALLTVPAHQGCLGGG